MLQYLLPSLSNESLPNLLIALCRRRQRQTVGHAADQRHQNHCDWRLVLPSSTMTIRSFQQDFSCIYTFDA